MKNAADAMAGIAAILGIGGSGTVPKLSIVEAKKRFVVKWFGMSEM
ncbi:MAG TPA: hypothetical protein VGG97_13500 [Bryobacteraceae bacterium]